MQIKMFANVWDVSKVDESIERVVRVHPADPKLGNVETMTPKRESAFLLKLNGGHVAHAGRTVLVTQAGDLIECSRDGKATPIAYFGHAPLQVMESLRQLKFE